MHSIRAVQINVVHSRLLVEKNGFAPFAQWVGCDPLRQLVIFLQFLRWQVEKIDLERSF